MRHAVASFAAPRQHHYYLLRASYFALARDARRTLLACCGAARLCARARAGDISALPLNRAAAARARAAITTTPLCSLPL